MHEIRYDWLADRWVLFAPNREERPNEFKASGKQNEPQRSNPCPFCFGAEKETPEPTLVLPSSDHERTRPLHRGHYAKELAAQEDRWKVRVVPNKFPAIGHTESGMFETRSFQSSLYREPVPSFLDASLVAGVHTQAVALAVEDTDNLHLFRREKATGCHEVVIESPNHVDSITALPTEQIELVLQAYQMRLLHWRAQQNLQCAVIFKNFGADAGASLSHSHSQLICLDFVPSDLKRMHQRLTEHHEKYGTCYICQMVLEEQRAKERIIAESEHFIVLCPFASRFPFAFSILPKRHRCHFEELSLDESRDLAAMMRSSLVALERAQPAAAYNYVFQTSPFHRYHPEAHHWRLRVIPRLSKVAGFEWGSDCFINTTKPETAAEVLRNFLD
jgi:UDPglucose--hexose-1-phosphate uridylyltransferase